MNEELRCPECRALISAEAEWCGQCLSPLSRSTGEVSEADRGSPARDEPDMPSNVVALGRRGRMPTWPCPSCGNDNPIELDSCAVCGTAFAKLFKDEEEEAPHVEPRVAMLWSLALPGLGHWRLGRRLDGTARMVLFVWTAGTTLVLFLSRSGKGGLGSLASLVLLFLGSAAILYVVSVLDAYRIASGETPVVSPRMLLWGSAALVLLSTILATVVALPAVRGR